MAQYDTDYLIAQVKRRASLPTSQNLFTDAKLVLMLDDELKTRLVPFMMSFQDNWFIARQSYSGDGSTTTFAIPSNAVGQKLKDISIWSGGTPKYSNVPRVEYENLAYATFGYYLEGTQVKFYPPSKAPATGDTVELTYYRRVSNLVGTSEARAISAISSLDIDSSTTLPSTFTTGTEIQIVSKSSPFSIVWTGEIANITGNTITLDSTPTGVSVGDWICLAGETVFAEIPIECIPMLCQSVVIRCMEAMNDREGLKNATDNFQQIQSSTLDTISPRVDSSPAKIFTGNKLMGYL